MGIGKQAAMIPEQKAREILARYWDRSIPVLPEQIARSMGVEVLGQYHQQLSGEFVQDGTRRQIIFNTSESPLRQRFTIAHELGHYVLEHGSSLRDPAEHFTIDNYDLKEADANKFAAELLVPSEAIRYLIQNGEENTVEGLAQRFQVSTLSLSVRLREVGYL